MNNITMNRMEIYQKIKELNLQDTCKTKYGKNFTMCSTVNLLNLIEEVEHGHTQVKANANTEIKKEPKVEVSNPTYNTSNIEDVLRYLIDSLKDECAISKDVHSKCMKMLNSAPSSHSEDKSDKMSQAEIDDMFDFVNKH